MGGSIPGQIAVAGEASAIENAPLVSIVTPVYQMARYIGETLDSVFAQDYPRIEYIVMDGGSTDGTLEILRRYERRDCSHLRFRVFSEPDRGTADAINKGFARAVGSILGFLNADDTYLPGAVTTAVAALERDRSLGGVYGEADWVNTDGTVLGRYPTEPFHPERLREQCFICQPASLLRREALDGAGMLDTSLNYGYDYDLWIRVARKYKLVKLDQVLARSRMHTANKTIRARRMVLRETIQILERHYRYAPFSQVLAYTAHFVDGQDQFFSPFQPSLGKYLLSLPVGWRFNWRHPLRYAREWAAVMRSDR